MIKRIVLAFSGLLLLLAFVGAGVFYWGMRSLEQPFLIDEPRLVMVEPGAAFNTIIQQLENDGLVANGLWLRVHARMNAISHRVRAGEYEVLPGMTPLALIDRMLAGQSKTWPVRFIEGRRFSEFRAELERQERLTKVLTGLDDAEVMRALGLDGQHPEGLFFPDTYLYHRGQTDLEVLRWAYERMQAVLEQEWALREEGLPYTTPYEALIMASIVEKETGVAHERGDIAGVFVRRLRLGMRLQTDPTVIYGLGDGFDGDLKKRHLQESTPYNTYVIPALPPTPIAAPGREAIHAALHPKPGTALFFVAKGDGTHQFSDTLKAHEDAVRTYQIQKRAQNYRSSPPPARALAADAEPATSSHP